jgi:hypothetical protein
MLLRSRKYAVQYVVPEANSSREDQMEDCSQVTGLDGAESEAQ